MTFGTNNWLFEAAESFCREKEVFKHPRHDIELSQIMICSRCKLMSHSQEHVIVYLPMGSCCIEYGIGGPSRGSYYGVSHGDRCMYLMKGRAVSLTKVI